MEVWNKGPKNVTAFGKSFLDTHCHSIRPANPPTYLWKPSGVHPLRLSGYGLGKKQLMRLIEVSRMRQLITNVHCSVLCSRVSHLWPGLALHGSGWNVSEWHSQVADGSMWTVPSLCRCVAWPFSCRASLLMDFIADLGFLPRGECSPHCSVLSWCAASRFCLLGCRSPLLLLSHLCAFLAPFSSSFFFAAASLASSRCAFLPITVPPLPPLSLSPFALVHNPILILPVPTTAVTIARGCTYHITYICCDILHCCSFAEEIFLKIYWNLQHAPNVPTAAHAKTCFASWNLVVLCAYTSIINGSRQVHSNGACRLRAESIQLHQKCVQGCMQPIFEPYVAAWWLEWSSKTNATVMFRANFYLDACTNQYNKQWNFLSVRPIFSWTDTLMRNLFWTLPSHTCKYNISDFIKNLERL